MSPGRVVRPLGFGCCDGKAELTVSVQDLAIQQGSLWMLLAVSASALWRFGLLRLQIPAFNLRFKAVLQPFGRNIGAARNSC
jgi:hypothetical protein